MLTVMQQWKNLQNQAEVEADKDLDEQLSLSTYLVPVCAQGSLSWMDGCG